MPGTSFGAPTLIPRPLQSSVWFFDSPRSVLCLLDKARQLLPNAVAISELVVVVVKKHRNSLVRISKYYCRRELLLVGPLLSYLRIIKEHSNSYLPGTRIFSPRRLSRFSSLLVALLPPK